MKKILSTAVLLIAAAALWAQKPVIEFQQTTHDFGKINEADGRVTTVFNFTNTGMSPLVLSDVRASCGCTTPKWTREPVEPGQQGAITVTYNPNGRPGRFQKTITITSNADPATTKLFIKGEVIPKTAKPVDNYPVKMGNLGLKVNTIDFGDITKGTRAEKTIGYANQTNDTLRVECLSAEKFIIGGINVEKQVAVVAPNTMGELQITFDAEVCGQYGPVDATLFVVVNGEEDKTRQIQVKANVKEDFTNVKEETAPIADIQDKNLGTFAQGKRNHAQFNIANAGVDALIVRRIICNDSRLDITVPKAVKSGKKGAFRVQMDTMEKGNYTSEVTLITNDPKNSVVKVNISWTIE